MSDIIKKRVVVVLSIIFFSLFLRTFNLDKIPSGFYNDETLVGYEAYSILKTGKDQFGRSFPISFKAFGDYRPGLYIYSIVPSIAIFGLNEFAVRFPSAVFNISLVLITYFLAHELLKNRRIALLAALWLSIVPFSLLYGRIAHDTNLATLLMSLGILLYLKARKNKYLLIPAAGVLSLSVYVYYTTRVIIPLFILYFLYQDFKWIFKNIKISLSALLTALVIVIPIILSLVYSPETFFSRSNHVNLWGDKGWISNILQGHLEDTYTFISSVPRIYHNKIIDGFFLVSKSFLNHFNIDFLVFYGDPDNLYKVPSFGIIYILDLILIITGLALLNKYKSARSILIFWLIAGLIPDTLTRLSPASARIHFILPALGIILALAVNHVYKYLYKNVRTTPVYLFLSIWYLFTFSFYLHQYYNHLPVRYAREWHYGLKELVNEIEIRQNNYDKIWVSRTLWGWINFAFYLQYPPQEIQKEIVLTDIDQYGLGWVYSFNKYYFDYLPIPLLPTREKILYVAEPGEFPKKTIPDKIIYYPDKSEAYYLVSSDKIKPINLPQPYDKD